MFIVLILLGSIEGGGGGKLLSLCFVFVNLSRS